MTTPEPAFEPEIIDERPGTFHHRPFDDCGRSLWFPALSAPRTLVLGSSQSETDVDHDKLAEHNIELATRRTGGGAVLVGPEDLVWFDVVLPSTDPLWHHDVGRSFDWLGIAVQRALEQLGVRTERHSGRLVSTEWSRQVCFAGLGPGELTIDGRKVVGMSQRRTRTTSRIQVAILLRWDGALHSKLLPLNATERQRAASELADVATGLHHSPADITKAVLTELQTAGLPS